MSYAVIRTGGKQYRVEPGDVIRVEKLDGEAGAEILFNEVLATGDGSSVHIGQPLIDGAIVKAQVVQQGRAKKILIYKKKRRKNYRRRQGHRQCFTAVRVTQIESGAGSNGS